MEPQSANLIVRAPDGREWPVELDRERLTVGRPTPASRPDVALEPDPQHWVGRLHCTLENQTGTWWVKDNAAVNGTLLRRQGVTRRIIGAVSLQHRDTICILASLTPDEEPLFWELTLNDPFTTNPAPFDLPELGSPARAATPCLEYDWVSVRVYRCDGDTRTEISGLRPQAHQLIRFMADVSRRNGGSPVACSYDDLIRALWGEREEWPAYRTFTSQDVRHVVSDVRQRIEPDPARPSVLQTVKGFGYRLVMCPESPDSGDHVG